MDQKAAVKTVERFKEALESANIQVERLILFGSHATNTAREDSDIDVVVISPSFSDKGYWERIDILHVTSLNCSSPHFALQYLHING